MYKKELNNHVLDKDVHVSSKEKEDWNNCTCNGDGSGEGQEQIQIPTKLSELENDTNFVTAEGMSVYATEKEVRSWLDGYQKKDDIPEGTVLMQDVNCSKVSIKDAKSIGLSVQDNKISTKAYTAQIASIVSNISSAEYGTSPQITLTAQYKQGDMRSLSVTGGSFRNTPISLQLVDEILNITQPIKYTLTFIPTEDPSGTAEVTISVSKRYYTWYSDNGNITTIPDNASNQLLTQKPSKININADSGKYTYIALPISWNADPSQFKVDGLSFANLIIGTCDGQYGLENDYIIIRSSETGIGQLTITT